MDCAKIQQYQASWMLAKPDGYSSSSSSSDVSLMPVFLNVKLLPCQFCYTASNPMSPSLPLNYDTCHRKSCNLVKISDPPTSFQFHRLFSCSLWLSGADTYGSLPLRKEWCSLFPLPCQAPSVDLCLCSLISVGSFTCLSPPDRKIAILLAPISSPCQHGSFWTTVWNKPSHEEIRSRSWLKSPCSKWTSAEVNSTQVCQFLVLEALPLLLWSN